MLDKLEFLMKERKTEYIRIDGNTKQDKRYDYVRYFQSKYSFDLIDPDFFLIPY